MKLAFAVRYVEFPSAVCSKSCGQWGTAQRLTHTAQYFACETRACANIIGKDLRFYVIPERTLSYEEP